MGLLDGYDDGLSGGEFGYLEDLMRPPPTKRREPVKRWTSIGVPDYPGEVYGDRHGVQSYLAHPQHEFEGKYLIVTTPGWYIVEARVGIIPFLHNVDGEAYTRFAHDQLERIGQLDRHRLDMPKAQIGNLITFRVRSHYPKLKGERGFTAVLIGEEDASW